MAAPKGNQFWKLRSKHGRDVLFASPELLWEAACEYFQWCDEHPWISRKIKSKNITSSVSTDEETNPTPRPYSLSGLCFYLQCNEKYFQKFNLSKNKQFAQVISDIRQVIETQQFEGATVGAFNASIIARKLGLADKQELQSQTHIVWHEKKTYDDTEQETNSGT